MIRLALTIFLSAAAIAPSGVAAAAAAAPYQRCLEARQLQAGWEFLGDYVRVRRRYDDRRELMTSLKARTATYAEGFTRVKSQRLWDRKKTWDTLLAEIRMGQTPAAIKKAVDALARGLAAHYTECMRP